MLAIFITLAFTFGLFFLFGCTVEKYVVVFHTFDEDNVFEPVEIKQTNFVSYEFPTPTKTGYTFDGWFLDSEYTIKYDSSKLSNGINELYAKYTINEYTIAIHNDDNTTTDYVFKYNEKVVLDEPEKDGYTFVGYYTDIELTQEFNSTNMPSENMELYPKFIEICKYYNVNYEVDPSMGFLIGRPQQLVEDSKTTDEVEVKALDGYRFIGWDDSFIGNIRSDTIYSNKTFIAQFEKTYTLTIIAGNSNYGFIEGETKQVLVKGEISSKVMAVPFFGYKFKSWSNGFT